MGVSSGSPLSHFPSNLKAPFDSDPTRFRLARHHARLLRWTFPVGPGSQRSTAHIKIVIPAPRQPLGFSSITAQLSQ
jgi:hypothetical protein